MGCIDSALPNSTFVDPLDAPLPKKGKVKNAKHRPLVGFPYLLVLNMITMT